MQEALQVFLELKNIALLRFKNIFFISVLSHFQCNSKLTFNRDNTKASKKHPTKTNPELDQISPSSQIISHSWLCGGHISNTNNTPAVPIIGWCWIHRSLLSLWLLGSRKLSSAFLWAAQISDGFTRGRIRLVER